MVRRGRTLPALDRCKGQRIVSGTEYLTYLSHRDVVIRFIMVRRGRTYGICGEENGGRWVWQHALTPGPSPASGRGEKNRGRTL